ncbi:hypothetical protein [Oceanobacter mangrovi]|uniref:hypothetical protein n=1 Tax=Oceanobacter mangrovi TaxID=2862510 RepID=UPI001C8EABF8|nr:hypothetical protein [Oceanobacter mangrovi]
MRTLALLIGIASLAGCISVDDNNSVTNEQGETVSTETLSLNGFWDGQLDQATDIRLMIYQGTVYGLDETQGYYGTVKLSQSNQTVSMSLTGYAITASDTTALHYLADGTAVDYSLDGLVFTTTTTSDTLVGDYENDSTAGSFYLTDDGTWDTNSAVSLVEGEWTAGDYSLYITSLGSRASMKAVSSSVAGCTFSGYIAPMDKQYNLYDVSITERKNCDDYNDTSVSGYATITTDGELEFFLRKSALLYYMIFQR